MCLIIDTCKLDEFFPPNPANTRDRRDEAVHLRDLVRAGKLAVVYSTHGRFHDEFHKKGAALRRLAESTRDKKAYRLGKAEVEARMGELPPKLESDEPKKDDRHILALALASGARLLYTEDGPLARDFTNALVIGRPKGKVYSAHDKHAGLLHPHKLRTLCRMPQRAKRR